ncbi:MAG: hypothetical protein LBM75_03395 [Myxococcales bacterium]|jgi:hypothetical protein|nr:hypothetical protein [Myxococcales bacterium]
MKRIVETLLLTACLLLFTACQSRSASHYELDEMAAAIELNLLNSGRLEAKVTFTDRHDSLTFLQLVKGDSLRLRANGHSSSSRDEVFIGGMTYYQLSLSDVQPGSYAEVELNRGQDERRSALSSIYLPEAVEDLTSSSGSSRRDPREISWNLPVGDFDGLALRVTGHCIESYSRTLSRNDTSHVIPAGALIDDDDGHDEHDSCEITITVSSINEGDVAPEFDRGFITASSSVSIHRDSTR